MTKKVSKKRTKAPKRPFPPKFSTRGVRITGFRVEIEPAPPIVYEDKGKK